MAYLFGAGLTDIIDCGTGVDKAAPFLLWIRFSATSVNAADRRLCYLERASDGQRNVGLAFNDGASNNELTGGFHESAGPSFPGVSWVSGFTAGSIHTVGLKFDGSFVRLYADTDATHKIEYENSTTPDQESDLRFSIGNIRPGLSLSADCTIYEVAWFTTSLPSAAELAAMGSGTPPATPPDHYWALIDNALDSFGGAHGTVTGATVVAHSGTNLYAAAPGVTEVGSGSQRATIRASSVDNATAAYPANVVAGNLLVVTGAIWASGSGVPSIAVTDSLGTSYTVKLGAGIGYSSGFGQPFIAYGLAASSGPNTVTVNPAGASAYINGVIDEFTGVSATLDVDGGQSTGSSTTPADGLTTSAAGSLIIGAVLTEGPVTFTPGTGYTQLDEDETGDRQPYAAEFKVGGAAGAETVGWTLGAAAPWAVYSIALAVTAGGGTTIPKSVADTVGLTEGLTREAGVAALTFTPGAGVQVNTGANIPPEFSFWPDSGIGILNNGNGTHTFIAGSGGSPGVGQGEICRTIGTFDDFFSGAQDHAHIQNLKNGPDGVSVFRQWWGGGPIYKDVASGLLIMPTHNETDIDGAGAYYSFSGLARSLNNGDTWQDCGVILAPYHTVAEMVALLGTVSGSGGPWGGPQYLANEGWGQFLIIGGYMYIYYNNVDVTPITIDGIQGNGICVARALLADVVAAAATETVTPWTKYNAGLGGWVQPGIHGQGLPVIDFTVINQAMAYNLYRDRYIMMCINERLAGPMTFMYKESVDGINWSDTIFVDNVDGITVSQWDNPFKYWTLASPTGDPTILGQTFYLIGHRFADDTIWRFPITLHATVAGVVLSVEPGVTAFRGIGRGLFRGVG